MRPSPKTSILAPTRCGVEPFDDTIVTSAASSPRESASPSAAKTSWFISRSIQYPVARSQKNSCWLLASGYWLLETVQFTDTERFSTRQKCFIRHTWTRGCGDLAGIAIDLDERHTLRRIERGAAAPGQRVLHERRPDRQRRLRPAQAKRLIVVKTHPHHGQELGRKA